MNETVKKADNQVSIEIDGVEMQAPKGSMIIEAADQAGIAIPRFCYHKKLSIAANCRMCLVDVEKAPKPLPACATPVMDGMKVYTRSKRAQSAQQNVMEFLLINHPLDCPICDQGGECELQDVSMGFGRSASRFVERKRVVKDENLGSLISTEMTRCIHCTRCVRFLREVSGTDELGGMGRGEHQMISTFIGRSVDSEVSGNIIDLCPVGALTDKPFRFTARAWELRSVASVSPHDSVGSNLHYHTHNRHRRIMRAVPRDREGINETWLADRDRWGHRGLYSDDRATTPMVRNDAGELEPVNWDQALERAAELIGAVEPEEFGVLVSPRATSEEQFMAQKLARGVGSNSVDHRLRQLDFADQDAMGLHPGSEISLRDLSNADGIVLIGSNIRHDQPILGLKVRQAWRDGGRIVAINPLDYSFQFSLSAKSISSPAAMIGALAALADQAGVNLPAGIKADDPGGFAADAMAALSGAGRRVVVFGTQAASHPQASTLRHLARLLARQLEAHWCEVPAATNAAGAWAMGAVPHRGPGGESIAAAGRNVREMVERPMGAYLVYDFEPGADSAYGPPLQRALAQGVTVYCGAYLTEEIRAFADVVLPLAVAPEVDGSYINLEGRTQSFSAAGLPPGDARAGWKVLRVLGNALGLADFDYTRIEQVRSAAQAGEAKPSPAHFEPQAVSPDKTAMAVIYDLPIYATDALVRRSQALQASALGEQASLGLNPSDAQDLGMAAGDTREFQLGEQQLALPVRIDERVPRGCVRLPLGTAPFDATVATVTLREAADG